MSMRARLPGFTLHLCLAFAFPLLVFARQAAATVTVTVRSGLAFSEGTSFSGPVADVTDGRVGALPGDLTATITWGDGTMTAGTVAGPPFVVSGMHTYADEGAVTLSVSVTDKVDTNTGSGMHGESVAEGDALTPMATTFSAVEGQSFSGTVATFSDSNLTNVSADFTATIDWGDGAITAGVVGGSNGSFSVTGAHTYSEEGNFPVLVTLTDDAGTATAQAHNTAKVSEGDALAGTPTTFSATKSQAFTGVVATFSDSNTGNAANDFAAAIDWGDTTSSLGTISGGNGSFSVGGSHTYASAGIFPVKVTLADDAPGTAFAQVTSTANVQTAGSCTPNPTTLCLNNSRFAVTTAWRTPAGQSGSGMAVSLTSDTGYFWFFSPTNVEEVVKVLNGCSVNQEYWVFAGGLTNVKVTTTVIDTVTFKSATYVNPQNTAFLPLQDTSALAVCP
ncbi:MAG TPA: hypothetical protein VHR45_10585 [Thermoanaerobaculia bacterium]|nr:hypothetical protein [Thermoanaerobaculia bacterium]